MTRRLWRGVYLLGMVWVVALCAAHARAQTTIDFDGTAAPCVFGETTALRDLYAPLGVLFDGPGPRDGGAILNECGNFGVDAHSGTDFLAFNRDAAMMDGGIPRDPETILFDILQTDVSIFAAGGFDTNTFTMDAFDAGGALVDSHTLTVPARTWDQLSVSWPAGIAEIVLTEHGTGDAFWVYDDLTFIPVPEPATLSLLVLSGMLVARRR